MNTPQQAKHTPGRLLVEALRHNANGQLAIVSADDWNSRFPIKQTLAIVTDGKDSQANADRLAHCWNNHKALLEALQACITEDGALAWRNAEMAGRRLEAISNIARAAIQSATKS